MGKIETSGIKGTRFYQYLAYFNGTGKSNIIDSLSNIENHFNNIYCLIRSLSTTEINTSEVKINTTFVQYNGNIGNKLSKYIVKLRKEFQLDMDSVVVKPVTTPIGSMSIGILNRVELLTAYRDLIQSYRNNGENVMLKIKEITDYLKIIQSTLKSGNKNDTTITTNLNYINFCFSLFKYIQDIHNTYNNNIVKSIKDIRSLK